MQYILIYFSTLNAILSAYFQQIEFHLKNQYFLDLYPEDRKNLKIENWFILYNSPRIFSEVFKKFNFSLVVERLNLALAIPYEIKDITALKPQLKTIINRLKLLYFLSDDMITYEERNHPRTKKPDYINYFGFLFNDFLGEDNVDGVSEIIALLIATLEILIEQPNLFEHIEIKHYSNLNQFQ